MLSSFGPEIIGDLAPLLWDTTWLETAAESYSDWQESLVPHVTSLPGAALWHATPINRRPDSAAVTALQGLLSALLESLEVCNEHGDFSSRFETRVRPLTPSNDAPLSP